MGVSTWKWRLLKNGLWWVVNSAVWVWVAIAASLPQFPQNLPCSGAGISRDYFVGERERRYCRAASCFRSKKDSTLQYGRRLLRCGISSRPMTAVGHNPGHSATSAQCPLCPPKAEIDRDQQDQEEGEQRDHSAPTFGDSLLYLINTQQVFGTHKSSNEKRATSRSSAINPSA